jgi:AAA+ ATPase superfamily predicted ATPase
MAVMKFIGRHHELRFLEQHYASNSAVLLPIYGRRRVGKSRLIDEFIRDKPCIYFLGKRMATELQIRQFTEAAIPVVQNDALEHASFPNWETALKSITSLWKKEQKLLVVMDELQWTAEAAPELPSMLQALWDREWKHRGNLMIILCGSHVGFMEREILGPRSPLFGRRSDQIRLGPLPFCEAVEMLPNYGEADQAGVFFLVGGIPAYLERFQASGRSLPQAITEEFCSELRFLALEPNFLLREELREPARYFTILNQMATKRIRHKDLARQCYLDPGVLAGYLETLLTLGYIGKTYPVLPGKISPKQVQYEITDPMLRFWFRFIFPNLQLCRPGQEQAVFHQRIAPQLESYFGTRFEKLCEEGLLADYRKKQILWQHVGQYWDQDMQLDLVGVRQDKWIDFGECKWGEPGPLVSLAERLAKKCEQYPNKGFSQGLHLYLKHKPRGHTPPNTQIHYLANLFD